jgi:hypothetical protein
MALGHPISAAYPRKTERCRATDSGRLHSHWLEVGLIVQGSCSPDVTR